MMGWCPSLNKLEKYKRKVTSSLIRSIELVDFAFSIKFNTCTSLVHAARCKEVTPSFLGFKT
jgi:hypothetical protein